MSAPEPHECECTDCQQPTDSPVKEQHRRLNLFLSRLDEQQRRWMVGLEARRLGHGGEVMMARITGMDPKTIRRGARELDRGLVERPLEQIRLPGGGRKRLEKKPKSSPRSSKSSSRTRQPETR